MENWKEVKLNQIVNFNLNSYSKKDDWKFINYLDTSNITKNVISKIQVIDLSKEKLPSRAKRKVNIGDIVYSTVRPNKLHYGIIKDKFENFLVSTGFIVMQVKKNIANNKFIYYYITQNHITEKLQAIGEQSVSAYPSIKVLDIENIKINLPPLPEQKAIAKTLSCLDEKIELNNKINKNLEEMAQAIFKKWFIDFDYPLTEEEINNGGREFVDSELGKIPKGWKVGKLGESYITSMLKSGINNFIGEKVYLATADVENTNIINRNTKITLNEKPSRANMQPKSKTVWFAKMKDSRKLIVIDDYSEDLINNYIFSTGFAGIECFNNSLYYIWAYLLTNEFDITKNNLCNGTTMQAINNENINKINILIPTVEVLKLFEEISLPIFKKWYMNNKENEKLTQIRDTLLPKLINGDIRVPF